jgi:hypothetical protein
MKKIAALVFTVALLSGCAGIRQTGNQFTTHAECFRIIGIPIPADDQAAARKLVPEGATITDVSSTPADWDSFVGFIGNLFWFHQTKVSGTK